MKMNGRVNAIMRIRKSEDFINWYFHSHSLTLNQYIDMADWATLLTVGTYKSNFTTHMMFTLLKAYKIP